MNDAPGGMTQLALLAERAEQPGDWQIRTSRRARRLAVRVLPGGQVEIVVPPGTRPRAVEQFVARHRRWIDRKLLQYRPIDATPAGAWPEEIQFAACGERRAIGYRQAQGVPQLREVDGRLLLSGDLRCRTEVREALQLYVQDAARRILLPCLVAVAAETGLGYAGAQIRRQRTRWGSCSRRAMISLNACLLFQPAEVVRYLLIHELAHTRHLNHSQRFWNLVARLEPRWRELDRELAQGWRLVPVWAIAAAPA